MRFLCTVGRQGVSPGCRVSMAVLTPFMAQFCLPSRVTIRWSRVMSLVLVQVGLALGKRWLTLFRVVVFSRVLTTVRASILVLERFSSFPLQGMAILFKTRVCFLISPRMLQLRLTCTAAALPCVTKVRVSGTLVGAASPRPALLLGISPIWHFVRLTRW